MAVDSPLEELFSNSDHHTPRLYGDNRAANLLASAQASVRNHRHLQLPQMWVRSLTKEGRLQIFNIDTHLNSSDMLTKVLPHEKLKKLLDLIGYQLQ